MICGLKPGQRLTSPGWASGVPLDVDRVEAAAEGYGRHTRSIFSGAFGARAPCAGGGVASPFSWDLYERATLPHAPNGIHQHDKAGLLAADPMQG